VCVLYNSSWRYDLHFAVIPDTPNCDQCHCLDAILLIVQLAATEEVVQQD